MKTTKMSRLVMPGEVNHRNTLFGGRLLEWMDEVAGTTAYRFCRQDVATVAVENVSIHRPIPSGAFLDVTGTPVSVGNTSMRVKVELTIDGEEDLPPAAEGIFVFVALDGDGKPRKIGRRIEDLDDE